jgi:hypothetical protein
VGRPRRAAAAGRHQLSQEQPGRAEDDRAVGRGRLDRLQPDAVPDGLGEESTSLSHTTLHTALHTISKRTGLGREVRCVWTFRDRCLERIGVFPPSSLKIGPKKSKRTIIVPGRAARRAPGRRAWRG